MRQASSSHAETERLHDIKPVEADFWDGTARIREHEGVTAQQRAGSGCMRGCGGVADRCWMRSKAESDGETRFDAP